MNDNIFILGWSNPLNVQFFKTSHNLQSTFPEFSVAAHIWWLFIIITRFLLFLWVMYIMVLCHILCCYINIDWIILLSCVLSWWCFVFVCMVQCAHILVFTSVCGKSSCDELCDFLITTCVFMMVVIWYINIISVKETHIFYCQVDFNV